MSIGETTMNENERRQRRAARILAEARQTLASKPDYTATPKRYVSDWPLPQPDDFEPAPAPPPRLDTRPPSQVDTREVDNRIATAVNAAVATMRRELVDALRVVAEEITNWREEDDARTQAAVAEIKVQLATANCALGDLKMAMTERKVFDAKADDQPPPVRRDLN
jgi:hypothetical protein